MSHHISSAQHAFLERLGEDAYRESPGSSWEAIEDDIGLRWEQSDMADDLPWDAVKTVALASWLALAYPDICRRA